MNNAPAEASFVFIMAGFASKKGNKRREEDMTNVRTAEAVLTSVECGIGSVGVDAGGLDDRSPTRDLAFQLGLQRCARRQVRGHRLGAEFGEARCHIRILKRLLQRRGKTLEHVLRRSL